MKKRIITLLFFFFCLANVFAQEAEVKGKVVDLISGEPLPNTQISIQGTVFTTTTDATGEFSLKGANLPKGEQVLLVEKNGYTKLRMPITIQSGGTVNLIPILLEVDFTQVQQQIGTISLADDELDQDDGTSTNVSGLLQASNDVFLNAASFDFSATFFRPRGLDNSSGKVLINGLEMNKQFDGRPQWSDWGGLNDAQRNRDFSMGLTPNDYAFGDIAGTTNIIMRASQYRSGGQVSYAASDRTYEGRVMVSYNSGVDANGWAYSVLASRRYGNGGFIEGTLYDANSFFASVEKIINPNHSLNFTAFYTPNRRGRSTALTQEVLDLKGNDYNPYWGRQDGDIRNSRIRKIEEPVFMLNHNWTISDKTRLNTNVGYQLGKIGNTRIDNNGTTLYTLNGQETFVGGARNADPNYYQRLPSYFLRDPNPTAFDFQNAFLAQEEFLNNGQYDWEALYRANQIAAGEGKNAVYAIQEDRIDDKQISANSILSSQITDNIVLNAGLNYRGLKSENFANLKDLLGGTGYLDIDSFAEDGPDVFAEDLAQSDLRNRNRIVGEGDRYKYNYEIEATVYGGFAQAQFKYSKIDFYVAAEASQTKYQRDGLYENGNYPGNRSFGKSEELSFTDYGVKGGFTYKLTGRHLFDLNAGYITKAPGIRNSFSNARQNNDVVIGLDSEKYQSLDASYIFRSPIIKARLTGFYVNAQDATEIGFFFTQSLQGQGADNNNAFVQEITTGIEKLHFGGELGIEAQVTPTIKLKAAASVGQYTYNNNPNVYYTSDAFDGQVTYGDGTAKLKDFHLSGGPEQAYQFGFEYRDPDFWWVGATANYFSDAYINISKLRRTDAFTTDTDGLPFNDYDENVARQLLQQEDFGDYYIFNLVGGKSWKIDNYFVGFFATVNNVFNQEFKTGGFEDSRNADFRKVSEDAARDTPVFGSRYFSGFGRTYYVNAYFRF
ncbi:MAG: TonB-dependent receptor [Flavobacteriaceae bacterium CG18_big_fil_WC_8_21_14_2_50_34_36]|nr:MAG: TonB-dependent receptor [Flavobacteriaceae bacterium CG18_big_fil_WC_8_21_14_2_50_34_36]